MVKSAGAQRESDGVVVPRIAGRNPAGGKDPDFDHAGGGGKRQGMTGVARSIGSAVSPMLATALIGIPSLASVPFFLAGGIKIVYDVLLCRRFAAVRPPEERG